MPNSIHGPHPSKIHSSAQLLFPSPTQHPANQPHIARTSFRLFLLRTDCGTFSFLTWLGFGASLVPSPPSSTNFLFIRSDAARHPPLSPYCPSLGARHCHQGVLRLWHHRLLCPDLGIDDARMASSLSTGVSTTGKRDIKRERFLFSLGANSIVRSSSFTKLASQCMGACLNLAFTV